MKKLLHRYLLGTIVLGLVLFAISCSGAAPTTPTTPTVPSTPTTPTTPTTTATPPAIPHPLEGRDDCLICHGASGVKPVPADHTGRASTTCQSCHKPAS